MVKPINCPKHSPILTFLSRPPLLYPSQTLKDQVHALSSSNFFSSFFVYLCYVIFFYPCIFGEKQMYLCSIFIVVHLHIRICYHIFFILLHKVLTVKKQQKEKTKKQTIWKKRGETRKKMWNRKCNQALPLSLLSFEWGEVDVSADLSSVVDTLYFRDFAGLRSVPLQ